MTLAIERGRREEEPGREGTDGTKFGFRSEVHDRRLHKRLDTPGAQDSPYILTHELTFSPDDVSFDRDGQYDVITLRAADQDLNVDREGEPQLPVTSAILLLPPDRAVESVSFSSLGGFEFEGRYVPRPISGDSIDALPDAPPWRMDRSYPGELGSLAKSGPLRGYQMVKVVVRPLSFDARSQRLSLSTGVAIRVSLRPQSSTEIADAALVRRPGMRDGPFGEIRSSVRRRVANPELMDQFYPLLDPYATTEIETDTTNSHQRLVTPYARFMSEWPSGEGVAPQFLIITNNESETGDDLGDMVGVLQQYADEHTAFGLPTCVRTVDEIQAQYKQQDRVFSVRAFLRDAVAQWGSSYVMLAGDMNVVPTMRLGGPHPSTGQTARRPDFPADAWYTRFSATDAETWNANSDQWVGETDSDFGSAFVPWPSVYIGRLPIRNAEEAATLVSKLRRYQLFDGMQDYPGDPWYRTILVASGPTNDIGLTSLDNGMYVSERILGPFLSTPQPAPWSVARLYPRLWGVTQNGCECYSALAAWVDSKLPGPSGGKDYWEGNDLRDALSGTNTTPHVFFHVEHSNRGLLGHPTMRTLPEPSCGWTLEQQANCRKFTDQALESAISHTDQNQLLQLQNGGATAKYFWGFSGGSHSGMLDMDAVSEAAMRAPSGGAIGFVAKTSTCCGIRGDFFDKLIPSAFNNDLNLPFGLSYTEALDQFVATGGTTLSEINLALQLPYLGDPLVIPFSQGPVGLQVTTVPSTVGSLGIQNISVTVTKVSGGAASNALVCLRQGSSMYARALANASGIATFKGVLVQNASEDLIVSVWTPVGFRTTQVLPVAVVQPYVAYSSHVLDDCVAGGDCDGVLEAGEAASLTVWVKNGGSSSAGTGTLAIRPMPSMDLSLRVNGQFRPGSIEIGRAGAAAVSTEEHFRVPFAAEGIRVEGAPPVTGSLKERFRVWRDDVTGKYSVMTVSPSHSADSVFTGVITSEATLTGATKTGEGNDLLYAFSDSLWFQFRGDLSDDKLEFSSDAPTWVAIPTGTSNLGVLAPGDSSSVTYALQVLAGVPDQTNLPLTVTHQPAGSLLPPRHSTFVVTVAKPRVRFAGFDTAVGGSACGGFTWEWTPTIANDGSGAADSVVLTLTSTSGPLTVAVPKITISELLPGEVRSNGAFRLCGTSAADTIGFAWSLEIKTYHRTLLATAQEVGHGGGSSYVAPTGVRADLVEGGVMLSWNKIGAASGFWIGVRKPGSSPNPAFFTRPAAIFGTVLRPPDTSRGVA